MKSILAACDFGTDAGHAAERAARLGAELGATRGALLHVIESSWFESLRRVTGAPDAAELRAQASRELERIAAELRGRHGFALEPRIGVGEVVPTLLQQAADFDLLVLGAHGHHVLREMTVGTTAERLLRQSRRPVLVVRRPAAAAYRRVFVAVDFSPHAAQALQAAAALTPQADIFAVHVFEVPFAGKLNFAGIDEHVLAEYRARIRQDTDEQMQEFLAAAGVDRARVQPSIQYGEHVPTVLREQLAASRADLVVAGKRGKSLSEHLLVGSVALQLLAGSPCDVLVVQ